MSKLPSKFKFIDLSDYGRPVARWIANGLKRTSVTPIDVTTSFIISGLAAIFCMLYSYYFAAAFFLVLKSILDAADGELSRLKNTPSYTGRYYDSVADAILNFLFLMTIWYITHGSIVYMLLAYIGMQAQGSQYNYYYVILRNNVHGDTTSRVFEKEVPKAMKGEQQSTVTFLYNFFQFLYYPFDKLVYFLDKDAINIKPFPKWFMTMSSFYGLGFQLLLIGIMLMLQLEDYIIPFFVGYSVFLFVFAGIRKLFLRERKVVHSKVIEHV